MKSRIQSALKWSEKYTKTDMTYLAKGGFWLGITKIIGISASLITSIIFANMLPESTYGTYRYVLSIMAILVIPTLGGIDSALVRSVAKGRESTFFPAFRAKVMWGFLGSFASISVAIYYFINGDATLTAAFIIAAFFIPIMDPSNLFLAYLSGKKNFGAQARYQLIIRTISSLFVIGTIFLTSNILVILLIYFASYTILRLVFFIKISKTINRSTNVDKGVVPYGMHLTAQSIPTVMSKALDSIIVFQTLGSAALAGYALARLPLKQGQNVLRSVNTLALPSFSKREPGEIRRTLPKKILKSYLVVVPVIVLYWLLAETLFNTLYPQYTDYIFLSQILSLQLLFVPISLISTALTALGEKKRLYIYTVTTSLIRTLLFITLIPLFGLFGATASLILTAFVGSLLLIYLFIMNKQT